MAQQQRQTWQTEATYLGPSRPRGNAILARECQGQKSGTWWFRLLGLAGMTGALTACGTDSPLKADGEASNDPSSDGGSSVNASTSDGGNDDPTEPSAGGFLEDSGTPPVTPNGEMEGCATERAIAERLPANVYFLLDISGSMQVGQSDLAGNRWEAVRTALKDFLAEPNLEGLNMALNYFPVQESRSECMTTTSCEFGLCITGVCLIPQLLLDIPVPCLPEVLGGLETECDDHPFQLPGQPDICSPLWVCEDDLTIPCFADDLDACDSNNETCPSADCPTGQCIGPVLRDMLNSGFCAGPSSCDVTDYQVPAVARTELPGGVQPLVDSLDSIEPDTFAQTPTHIALQGAYDHVTEWRIDEPDVPAFVVMSTDGLPKECNSTPELVVDAITGGSQRGLETFVIGIADPSEEDLRERLDEWAVVGGTEQAYFVGADETIAEGFTQALDNVRGELLPCQYPIPEATRGVIDFERVNVEVTADGEVTQVPQAAGEADCQGDTTAWYYNEPEGGGDPTQVVLCPSVCETINQEVGNQLEVVFGCQTVRITPR